jgi:hypothetical protein|tara:strand:- start:238 stop:441 length:204 start_codon:yes stop_codon:yes gene_type:complete
VILDVNSLNIELMIRNSKNHLNEVNETYLKHMAVNFKIGLSTLVTGFKFLIHGIVPTLFKINSKEDN